ncbi:amino acid transporter [Sphingosinicella microcystinivorans]|uniref:Amino acid transporter n=2 Tax=Sphingosinicella microcystinivorans TaxID=335406 RepID=A0AAD1G0E4_SPHMI|nr:hypothetical protein DFR51_0221 [Sphingosinicella microcystinivorans]BBE33595.1 amino acid transporter [Sphingosinicella microcystinivorans]
MDARQLRDVRMTENKSEKLSFSAAWAMAVGGMIGGGIFSVLGVVIAEAGRLAWLSFVFGGTIALATGWSYSRLTVSGGRAGGIYQFLRQRGRNGAAAAIAWVLILGYVLTVSVYAHTFGAYISHAFGWSAIIGHGLGIAAILTITGVNLLGVGESSLTEIILVGGKLLVLGALAIAGLMHWSPPALSPSGEHVGLTGAVIGAALVFMAYEGFQLLVYDYEVMENPQRTLPTAMMSAIVAVILIYISVALGAAMLVGADRIVADKEVALAAAGSAAFGEIGLVVVTIAAAFSTGSAILATIFGTARLAHRVAAERDLPGFFGRTNSEGVPVGATLLIATAACLLVWVGSLGELVEGASLVFLLTFAGVNLLAWRGAVVHPVVGLVGSLGALSAAILLGWRMLSTAPLELAMIGAVLSVAAAFGFWRRRT